MFVVKGMFQMALMTNVFNVQLDATLCKPNAISAPLGNTATVGALTALLVKVESLQI